MYAIRSYYDEIQAAMLRVKLRHLDKEIEERRTIAEYYSAHIDDAKVVLPAVRERESHVWHLFVVRHENSRITSYNVCYTKLLRKHTQHLKQHRPQGWGVVWGRWMATGWPRKVCV